MNTKSLPVGVLVLAVVFMFGGPSAAEPPNFDIEEISIDVTCENLTLYVKGYSRPSTNNDRIQIEEVLVQGIDCSSGEPIGDEMVYDGLGALTVFTVPAVFEEEVTYSWEYLGVGLEECACYDITVHVYMPCNVHRHPNAELECPCDYEGCTPGYWKQEQHFGSWIGYSPTGPEADLFDDVFDRDAFPGKTLLQVLKLGGGGLNALGRHAVAALLNASSPDVDSGWTVAGVIQAFQEAYDEGGGAIEDTKDEFEFFNKLGCPLDNSPMVVSQDSMATAGCSSVNAVANAKAINLQLLLLVLGAVMLGRRVVRKR